MINHYNDQDCTSTLTSTKLEKLQISRNKQLQIFNKTPLMMPIFRNKIIKEKKIWWNIEIKQKSTRPKAARK